VRTLLALAALSVLALYACLSFERCWPIAFVALAPWTLLVLLAPKRRALWALVAVMPAYAAMHLQIGRIAWAFHPIVTVFVAVALAGTAHVFVALARGTKVPLALLVAPLWTAAEMVRSNELIPPWHRLATALYAQGWSLQVCDLGGMSALTFALAVSSGAAAACALVRFWPALLPHRRSVRGELVAAAVTWAFVAAYGWYRLDQAKHTTRDGPLVMVVQSDYFANGVEAPMPRPRWHELAALTTAALARGPKPALIVWPEWSLGASIEASFLRATPDAAMAATLEPHAASQNELIAITQLRRQQAEGAALWAWLSLAVRRFDAPLLVGGPAIAERAGAWRRYNAAFLVEPGAAQPTQRHDKITPFPVYEAIPWDDVSWGPLRWLHDRLATARSQRADWPAMIDRGRGARTMTVQNYRVATPICFETETPEFEFEPGLSGADRPDFWVQIANDAWGERSDDTLRAFRFNVFRSVETRVTIARSANASVTGFTDPSGAIYGVVGGDQAARMPAAGRPERAALATLRALQSERAQLEQAIERAPADAPMERERAELAALIERSGVLRRQARDAARSVARVGASVERVRVDSRRTVYVATRGASDRILVAAWWCAVLLCAARASRERIRARVQRRR
jgi:apolipoprotein N-acyltransferase